MKRYLLCLLLLCNYLVAYAQKKPHTLVIDTLITNSSIYIISGNGQTDAVDTTTTVISNNYPYYTTKYIAEYDDSLFIKLDNKEGMFCISGLNKITTDTLRISKWQLFDCGLSDSTVFYKTIWNKYNDSLDESSLTLDSGSYNTNHKGAKYPPHIVVHINGKIYNAILHTGYSHIHISFHGYLPRKKYAKFQKWEEQKPGKHKVFKYKYFHGEGTTYKGVFEGSLQL